MTTGSAGSSPEMAPAGSVHGERPSWSSEEELELEASPRLSRRSIDSSEGYHDYKERRSSMVSDGDEGSAPASPTALASPMSSTRSTRTASSLDELDKRARDNPSIVFGRDVIQVPLKAEDRGAYVNLVLSHREFDAMAVHIPQYDEVEPLELLEQIARVVKDAEAKKKLKLGLSADGSSDSAAVFQARILELEFEIKRLTTKLTAAKALQANLTDENTTLRMTVRELDETVVDYEQLYMQNELLREQALDAVSEMTRIKRVAADAQAQVVAFAEELKALKSQVVSERDGMFRTTQQTFAALVENVHQREKILQDSYLEEKAERQLMAERYYELSGRIRVFSRLRPAAMEDATSALLRPRPNSILVEKSGKEFVFDQVFGPESTQPEVYRQVEPLVVSFADGFNACILAYGQTGSGKTYTMMGNSDEPKNPNAGMIPRALEQVFAIVEARKLSYEDSLTVSMVEIYNDQILDLLDEVSRHSDSSSSGTGSSKHPAAKSESEIVARKVTVWDHVRSALAEGNANRNIASTNMNVESSRSHALVFLQLESQHRETKEVRRSTLCLVDLAGSERISRSKVEGDRLKETQHINKSLSALGDVVYALQHKAKHVPYRNSKLTYMLRDMLSGQAKTLMMLQLSPDTIDVEETKCSLNFGARVSQVQMGAVRQSVESGEIFKLKDETQSLSKKVRSLEAKLADSKAKCEQQSSDLKLALKNKRSLERQLWLLGGSENEPAPSRSSLHSSPQSDASRSPSMSQDEPLQAPPSPVGSVRSVRSTRSTMSAASTATARSTSRANNGGSTRRSLVSSFSRLIGGRGSPPPKSSPPSSTPATDRENRRKSLTAQSRIESATASREARRQSLGARAGGAESMLDREARRKSLQPRTDSSVEREARRRSLNPHTDSIADKESRRKSLSTLPGRSPPSLGATRRIPDAPSSLPTRRPLFPTSSSSSSIPTAPSSASRIPKTRGMAASFTSASATNGTPSRSPPIRRAMSSSASLPQPTGSGAAAAASTPASTPAPPRSGPGRTETRRSTLSTNARTTSAGQRSSTSTLPARRVQTTASWK